MKRQNIVLLDMGIDNEPLFLEFKDMVPIQNHDQIICEITEQQAYDIYNHFGSFSDDKIRIPSEIEYYLVKRKGKV